ncbi:50S ribosomal protein L37 [Methanocalculus chunghsingensis]|uniref:Large ribosomal subunit protein eL43 n=1 Tax=Methanocalculus chunghsingensis TaxID=156457 RepID=A0A8J7W9Z6_9EURY|nr:50S ribosomal protein L37ae [Methanocalculus chunghsingensis]MBR1368898.1 50S ribosomal protein L37 [Methanocalculus chunghsingensis]
MVKGKHKAKGRVTGSAGRYGPRYGRFIRKSVNETEKVQRAKHLCPRCDTFSVKRQGTGIWGCRKCGFAFAGGAYAPQTPGLKVALRNIEAATKKEA